jgi:hypothetical protein
MGRWRRHLDPNIRKCQWLLAEDSLLTSKYEEYGPKWSYISTFLEGRTAQQCRARWFQLSPADNLQPCPPVARHGNSRKDPVERHRDGASIQASARALLEQMDLPDALPSHSSSEHKAKFALVQRGTGRTSEGSTGRRSYRAHGAQHHVADLAEISLSASSIHLGIPEDQ